MKELTKRMGQLLKSLLNYCHQKNGIDRIFKIATWNDKHIQEIKTFIFYQNIDVVLVSKTQFINKNYFRVSGYILYHMHPDNKARRNSSYHKK